MGGQFSFKIFVRVGELERDCQCPCDCQAGGGSGAGQGGGIRKMGPAKSEGKKKRKGGDLR